MLEVNLAKKAFLENFAKAALAVRCFIFTEVHS